MSKSNVKATGGMGGPFHSSLGDGAHIITLLSSFVFAGMVIHYINDESDTFFDAEWKKYGFCVSKDDVPFWNSHDLCFYADTIACAVLGIVYFMNRKLPGMEQANAIMFTGIPGVLIHGFAHGGIGSAIRSKDFEDPQFISELGYETIREKGWVYFIPQLVFFFFLLKASMPNVSYWNVFLFALLARLVELLTPLQFGFTYVQTVLLLAFSVNQLVRPQHEKDFHYTLYPIIVSLPLTFVGWMESTQCSSFVKDYLYGHLAYDAYIPIAMLLWYSLCIGRVKQYAKVKTI